MAQSGGISFLMQDADTGATEVYAVTIKFDPVDGPEITDNLGQTFVVEEGE